tara:strand:+ start:364 stop:1098 length:735 start_codon:yes stop_codon:yes gene_type:complete
MKKTLLLSSLLISFSSISADVNFNWLKSTSGQNSSLSGTCDNLESSNDMVCNLRQISVRKKLSTQDAKKSLVDVTLELDAKLKTNTIKEYVINVLGSACEKIPLSEAEIQSLGEESEAYNDIIDICNSPTRDKMLAFLTSSVKKQIKTCKVIEYDVGNYRFNQVNDKKWVSTNEPSGQCGAVTILTLENHPEHSALWDYSQIRHYTNTESEICKGFAKMNEPMSFSWNGASSVKMDCDYIEFGM